MPFETFEIGHSGASVSLSGDERHRFEADLVSVMIAKDHRAYFQMRMRQYRFSIVQELYPTFMRVDWGSVWVRVPPGSPPDAAALIARIAGVREAQPSPVYTTNVASDGAEGAPQARRS